MPRKTYAFFMALPENDFSIEAMNGAQRASAEADANFIVFPHGLVDGIYYDNRANTYRYQYNILSKFSTNEYITGSVVEYGTIGSCSGEERKIRLLKEFNPAKTVMIAEGADGFPSVTADNAAGIREEIKYFVKKKCKKILFISGPKYNQDAKERLGAYLDTMDELGFGDCGKWVGYGNFSHFYQKEIEELIDNNPDADAILFANDGMAFSAYSLLKDRGYKIGHDIYVAGFDDSPSAIIQSPALASIKVDISELSYTAIQIMEGKLEKKEQYMVPSKFVPRESSGDYSAADGDYSDNDSRYNVIARNRIEMGNMSKECLGEVSFVLREAVLRNGQNDDWYYMYMESLHKLGAEAIYIYLYEDVIMNYAEDEWQFPEKIYLRAYRDLEESAVFAHMSEEYDTKELLNIENFRGNKRSSLYVIPLFYREMQMGILCVYSDIEKYQFMYRMAALLSNMMHMARINKAEEQIHKELILANRAKSMFLANMSHEFRTPINAIIGMNEMILRETSEENISKYAYDIKNAAESLLAIANDVLDLTRIEMGKMEIIPVEYRLEDMVRNIVSQIGFRVRNKKIVLNLEIDDELPSVVKGDDNRIRQVLNNLMTNSIKYTQEGSVTLKVGGNVSGDVVNLDFSVIDTGVGIKPEDLSKLYARFERIDEEKNRNIEGSGLGMSITTGLLELMGSKLDVESTYGKGSTFYFTIEQEIIDKTPIREARNITNVKSIGKKEFKQAFTAKGKKLLLVDDNKVNRMVIIHLLKLSGIVIDEAEDGLECLEKMKNNDYDLILLDHMMPNLDGMETLERIKQFPDYEKGHPPIVALTANAIEGMEAGYIAAGFDAYLSKPVLPDKLDELLMRFLNVDVGNIQD